MTDSYELINLPFLLPNASGEMTGCHCLFPLLLVDCAG